MQSRIFSFYSQSIETFFPCQFFAFSVVVVSRPGKTILHRGQSRSWSAKQGNESKRKPDHERDWRYAGLGQQYMVMSGRSPPLHCVCVFFPFILDIKFVGRTSRGHTGGRSHRIISHPPSFCGACLNFSREKDSAFPFPRRP